MHWYCLNLIIVPLCGQIGIRNKQINSRIFKNFARIISNNSYETPSSELISNLKWMLIEKRFEFQRVSMMYKCRHHLAPSYLQESLIKVSDIHQHNTRQVVEGLLSVPKYKTEYFKHSPLVSSIITWNQFDRSLRMASSVNTFKYMFKQSCIIDSQKDKMTRGGLFSVCFC